jgi:hypothetical protein
VYEGFVDSMCGGRPCATCPRSIMSFARVSLILSSSNGVFSNNLVKLIIAWLLKHCLPMLIKQNPNPDT